MHVQQATYANEQHEPLYYFFYATILTRELEVPVTALGQNKQRKLLF